MPDEAEAFLAGKQLGERGEGACGVGESMAVLEGVGVAGVGVAGGREGGWRWGSLAVWAPPTWLRSLSRQARAA